MLEGINLLHLAGERMRYLSDRQSLISRNIANADTPGYRTQDLEAFTPTTPLPGPNGLAAGQAPRLQMVGTSAGVNLQPAGSGSARVDGRARAYDEKPDANNVSIEEQMVKANDVANAFDLASVAYRKSIALLKSSLGAPA
jgi:flagellar basal-body rod protein FlgB